MNKRLIRKKSIFLILSFLLLMLFIYDRDEQISGIILMFFFISLSFVFQYFKFLKSLSFTAIILAGVSIAMFYPQKVLTIGEFNLSILIVPLLQIIMFGMGTKLSIKDFLTVFQFPKKILVGIICQFSIMPLVALFIINTFPFEKEIAAGIILIGCCPSGLASNVMAYLARANLALSVSITTIATLLSPILTPFLMKTLAGNIIQVDLMSMVWDITKIVILPIVLGLIFNRFVMNRKSKFDLDKIMPIISMAGIAIILTIMTAAGRDSLLEVGKLLIIASLLHNVLGYLLGYWTCRSLKMEESDCRSVALEVGMQNAGLASGLALTMGKMATLGVASVVFGPVMNITGSSLSSWWYHHLPKGMNIDQYERENGKL